MPTYDYRCPSNGRVVEVKHRMAEKATTWGQLCDMASINPEDTPLDSPVERLATGGNVVTSNSLNSGNEPPCASGGCCPGGACGI